MLGAFVQQFIYDVASVPYFHPCDKNPKSLPCVPLALTSFLTPQNFITRPIPPHTFPFTLDKLLATMHDILLRVYDGTQLLPTLVARCSRTAMR